MVPVGRQVEFPDANQLVRVLAGRGFPGQFIASRRIRVAQFRLSCGNQHPVAGPLLAQAADDLDDVDLGLGVEETCGERGSRDRERKPQIHPRIIINC